MTSDYIDYTERLLRTTVLLRTERGAATGFFFNFSSQPNIKDIYIVTNRHVVDKASSLQMELPILAVNGSAQFGKIQLIIKDLQERCIYHPDYEGVDLCIIDVNDLIDKAMGESENPLCSWVLSYGAVPSFEQVAQIECISDVFVIGYPYGKTDTVNSVPIVRKGITATPYKYDYEGRKRFVVDCFCRSGMSGSPVVVLDSITSVRPDGEVSRKFRFFLIGILYASGLELTDAAKKEGIVPSKAKSEDIADWLNLGFAEKAEQLLAFGEEVSKRRFGESKEKTSDTD